MNNFDTMNPETWTIRDRNLLDRLRALDPEQIDFLLDLLQIIDERKESRKQIVSFMKNHADDYRLNTTGGRSAFLAAVQAM